MLAVCRSDHPFRLSRGGCPLREVREPTRGYVMYARWLQRILLIVLIFMTAACNLSSRAPTSVSNSEEAVIETSSDDPLSAPAAIAATPGTTGTRSFTIQITDVSDCTARTDWAIYVVKNGDTLSDIARRTGSTVSTLGEANCLENVSFIRAGQQLRVPYLP